MYRITEHISLELSVMMGCFRCVISLLIRVFFVSSFVAVVADVVCVAYVVVCVADVVVCVADVVVVVVIVLVVQTFVMHTY